VASVRLRTGAPTATSRNAAVWYGSKTRERGTAAMSRTLER